jgi:hypothetical protein
MRVVPLSMLALAAMRDPALSLQMQVVRATRVAVQIPARATAEAQAALQPTSSADARTSTLDPALPSFLAGPTARRKSS